MGDSPNGSVSVNTPSIVIGFVGGFVKHDDSFYPAVQLAAQLGREYSSNVYVQVFENRRGEEARRLILKLLDADRNGVLAAAEKRNARIVLYGQSWGGSQAVTLARDLGREGIPVLLTVQVDSVRKMGQDDVTIPANVAQAINFYQPHGWIHGLQQIVAADSARTRILGNFEFDYTKEPYRCSRYSWFDRAFAKSHLEIECDPKVWTRIEALIRSQLPPVPAVP